MRAGRGVDAAYSCFGKAWRAMVLPKLKYRFEAGPVDWTAPPSLPPVAASIAMDLVAR